MYYNSSRNTPSVATLEKYLKCTPEAARKVKKALTGKTDLMTIASARKRQEEAYNPHDALTLALEAVNELLGGYGAEYIASVDDTMHRVYGIEYVNFGDTYAPTLYYDHKDEIWRVGSWGDAVEMHMGFYP